MMSLTPRLTEICDRTLKQQGPALLFEQPKGYSVPLLGNLFGYGLGPLAIGSLSDLFAGMGLVAPLKWAIITVLCANVWAAAHFILAARHLRADLARAAG